MEIRKLIKFEGAHIVRQCSSRRCSRSVHGHSYKVEVRLQANSLDRANMIYDFGLLTPVKKFIDLFDHAIVLWHDDLSEYKGDMKKHSERWLEMNMNPSAESLSILFQAFIQFLFEKELQFNNEEGQISCSSVTVHETDTGSATSYPEDLVNILQNPMNGEAPFLQLSPYLQEEARDKDIINTLQKFNQHLTELKALN